MLNIMNLFNSKRDKNLKLTEGEKVREEHIHNGLKNYQGQIF